MSSKKRYYILVWSDFRASRQVDLEKLNLAVVDTGPDNQWVTVAAEETVDWSKMISMIGDRAVVCLDRRPSVGAA